MSNALHDCYSPETLDALKNGLTSGVSGLFIWQSNISNFYCRERTMTSLLMVSIPFGIHQPHRNAATDNRDGVVDLQLNL